LRHRLQLQVGADAFESMAKKAMSIVRKRHPIVKEFM
jgi:hypothetical protein